MTTTMRVLHICPPGDSMLANYAAMLVQSMGERVESRTTDNPTEARRLMREGWPQIVHQHGHVDLTVSDRRVRLVVSPHGEKADRLPRKQYVVIARSDIEAARLAEWPRIEVVRNPMITKTVRPDETAEKVLRIYRKVMDSDVLPLMNEATRKALRLLLKTALGGDRRWVGEDALPTADVQWRLLYIYAWHENIVSYVDRGLSLMGIQIPPRTTPISYLPEGYVRPKPQTGLTVAEMMRRMQQCLSGGRLPLLALCDLYCALHRPALDEAQLLAELEKEKLKALFQSALQLLKDELLLDEGYMPCAPMNNHTTAAIRAALANHLTI